MSKFYITTSIAYGNAQPHLGHALEIAQADTLARYHRHNGEDVFFLTGMDEHGLKIQQTAEANKQKPQQLVDLTSQQFSKLYADLGVSYDYFVRTTEPQHKAAAQKLWQACEKDIYQSSYTGLYCVGCERFYNERELVDGKCPLHHTEPQKVTEINYFFKLSAYTAKIKELIKTGALQVLPETRKNEILGLLEEGLEDVSISRSKEHLQWGISVPGDDTQLMYVWFDALSNYISAIGYGHDDKTFAQWWPADLQIIGKDILRFHAALWPAMLLSAGLQPPKALYVHGFITTEGEKMSKSVGNVIDPTAIVQKYGPEPLRYYLLRHIPSGQDGDFSMEHFRTVYETDLANELGNLVQRVLVMLQKYQGGAIGEVPPHTHDVTGYVEAMAGLRFDKALESVWDEVRGLNQYLEEEKPWQLAKSDTEQLAEVLAHAVSDLTQIAQMIMPFMPTTGQKIAQAFEGGLAHPEIGILFPKFEETASSPPTQ